MKHWTLGELESIPNSITTLDIGLKGLTSLQTYAKAKTRNSSDSSTNTKTMTTQTKHEPSSSFPSPPPPPRSSLTPAQQDISLNLKGTTDTLDKGEGNLYIMDSSRKSGAEIRIIF